LTETVVLLEAHSRPRTSEEPPFFLYWQSTEKTEEKKKVREAFEALPMKNFQISLT
jgi:hypothetical protein